MLGKLLLIILSAGLIAASLLVLRHRRIEMGHRMTRMHYRMLEQEQALWKLHCEIAYRCRPDEVRKMMEELNVDWQTFPDVPLVPASGPETESGSLDVAESTEAPTSAPGSGGGGIAATHVSPREEATGG